MKGAIDTLEQVLADYSEDAAVLRRRGHGTDAALIEQMVSEVRGAAEDWVTWLSESDAALRSGKTSYWFRRNRPYWRECGLARRDGKVWVYRQCMIPQRKHFDAIREDAKRAAQDAA